MESPLYGDFAGMVAVVTGGSRGEGAAISRLLAARGAAVAVCSRNDAAVAAVAAGIRAHGGWAIGAGVDCTDFAAIERLRWRVETELGPTDVLCALAGGYRRDGSDRQEAHLSVAVHLTATFLTVKSFLPGMVERRRGAILTLPTVAVFARHVARTVREHGVYVDHLDETARFDVARPGACPELAGPGRAGPRSPLIQPA